MAARLRGLECLAACAAHAMEKKRGPRRLPKKNTLVVERVPLLKSTAFTLMVKRFQTRLVGAIKFMVNESFRMVQADALSTPWQQEAELWTLQAQVDHLGFQDVVCSQCRQHFRGRRFANRIGGS